MAKNNTSRTPKTVTLRIEECEHTGDIERALGELPRGTFRVTDQRVCDGPEVGFVAVEVLKPAAFAAGLKASGWVCHAGNGNVINDLRAEEESDYRYENDEYEDGEW